MRKGISAVIATILMLVIVIAVSGTAYLYISGVLTGRVAETFSVLDTFNDSAVIRNDGTAPISSMTAILDGNPVETVFDLNKYLVAYWKFNEGSGTKARDSVQGLEVNLRGEWVDGKFGFGYKFVGGGWVRTDFASAIGNGITYVFWFRLPDTSDTYGTFFCVEDVADRYLEDNLGQKAYGDLGCYGRAWTNSGFNVNDANWHWFAFSKSTTSILCRDGDCVNLGDATNNIPNIKHIIFNGGCGCGYGNFRQGIILDEVRIYNKALSEAEIKALYAAKGETILEPGGTLIVKPIAALSQGRHTLRLCTASMCQAAHLSIT